MTSTAMLLAAVDRLYEAVVTDPGSWGEQALDDWAAEVAAGGLDRTQARGLRRCLRIAVRLRDFWSEGRADVAADDWRARVDVAMGPRAWRPTLEIAMDGLATEPTSELFDIVSERFRLVNNQPWLDGITYEEWVASR